MNFKYLILNIFLLLSLPLSLFAQGAGEVIDKIIVKVDNHIILQSELEATIFQLLSNGQAKNTTQTRCKVLESLAINKLLIAKAEIDSVIVEDKIVEEQLTRRMAYFVSQAGGQENLEKAYGKKIETLKLELRDQLKDQLVGQKMQTTITKDIKITPNEVKKFFNALPKDSIPFFSTEVEVGQIIRIPQITKAQKIAVKEKLEKIRERIIAGESFADLAELYSEDYGSAKQGGNLGFHKRGELVPEFEATAFKLKPNEVSSVIESSFGFHIIQLIERRGSEFDSRHILMRPNYAEVDLGEPERFLDSLKIKIAQDSITFEKAAKEYSDDKETGANGGMLMDEEGSSKIPLDSEGLDSFLFFTLDTMQVGTITKPLPYRTNDGKNGMRILYFKSKTPAHQANLKDDYQKIYSAALAEKKQKTLEKWFFKSVKEVYIYVDEELHDCKLFGLQQQ